MAQNAWEQESSYLGRDAARKNLLEAIARRNKRKATYEAKQERRLEALRREHREALLEAQRKQDRGWGKYAMIGAGLGSTISPGIGTAVGAGLGALAGLGKATLSRTAEGQNGLAALGNSIVDIPGGIIDPIMGNPELALNTAKIAGTSLRGPNSMAGPGGGSYQPWYKAQQNLGDGYKPTWSQDLPMNSVRPYGKTNY